MGALRLLIVEDVEDHALLIVRELRKAGFDVSFQRVETVEELKAALDAGSWDAVISDFNLPGFDGIDALRMVQEKGDDLPFLLVSGAIGEEKAAEVVRAGAHDYIRKGNYARLGLTLERELADAEARRERRRTAQELARYREHLEELVQERTQELEERNQELEAFNRMISHDLRQPLNTMSLSCQTIETFCGGQDGACRQAIESLSSTVLRMNTLIETLLTFSRSTHGELHREVFDISETAKAVIAELRQAQPHREVEFMIAEGLPAYGDPNFLRTVLDNLIGNAWKYTGKREDAVIEFGVTEVAGTQAYFVRDNGEGFDMADAAEIFFPFHRLKGADEFAGSGIGLATVERIIRRHRGRVWAEGEPGKGATFYFTLGRQQNSSP